jgi:putative phosphoribosyl transferase
MTTPGAPYLDRTDAGERIARELDRFATERVTVLGLPRGGVPVASIVADRLRAPLDILVVRKVGAPGNQEFGLGAVAEGGIRFLDRRLIQDFGLRIEDLEGEIRARSEEVDRLARRLRGSRPPASLQDRTVILVDDGIATGGTLRAAIEATRVHRPERVAVAVGVAPRSSAETLRRLADEVVCPLTPRILVSVSEWYRDFSQVSDAEVASILDRHWAGHPVAARAA